MLVTPALDVVVIRDVLSPSVAGPHHGCPTRTTLRQGDTAHGDTSRLLETIQRPMVLERGDLGGPQTNSQPTGPAHWAGDVADFRRHPIPTA
jgi:hypothetical protein